MQIEAEFHWEIIAILESFWISLLFGISPVSLFIYILEKVFLLCVLFSQFKGSQFVVGSLLLFFFLEFKFSLPSPQFQIFAEDEINGMGS